MSPCDDAIENGAQAGGSGPSSHPAPLECWYIDGWRGSKYDEVWMYNARDCASLSECHGCIMCKTLWQRTGRRSKAAGPRLAESMQCPSFPVDRHTRSAKGFLGTSVLTHQGRERDEALDGIESRVNALLQLAALHPCTS